MPFKLIKIYFLTSFFFFTGLIFPLLDLQAKTSTAAGTGSVVNGFACIPSLRETRFQVLEIDDKIEVLVTNAMGYDFMPQFEAPVSVFNIPFLKMQGEDLKDLGDQFVFKFAKDKCEFNASSFLLNCQGAATESKGAVKANGISTTEITEKYAGAIYEKRKFRLALENQNTYFVSLTFDKQFCRTFDKN